MLAHCTYCSANKNQSSVPIAAIELYSSKRISQVHDLAIAKNSSFFILSGKYGLLNAQQKVPYYDHLLNPSEVENHANLVAAQLKKRNISKIIFYTGNIELDENIKPYRDCMLKACAKCGVSIEIKASNFND